MQQPQPQLSFCREPGEFFKPCPGTTAPYLCCGYQIITPLTGCGMYCDYCVLQAYTPENRAVAYTNIEDLQIEVTTKLRNTTGIVRVGTGQFGDSLFYEEQIGHARRIAQLLEPYPNVIVEFKTKSSVIAPLTQIRDPSKVVIGFSMSTQRNISLFEHNTTTLAQRLELIQACLEMGFFVAIHYDPMIRYAAWESEYADLTRRILDTIGDPTRIAWWSMGGLRGSTTLQSALALRNKLLPLFDGEMVSGEDGKIRYFRPLRTEMYRCIAAIIERCAPEIALYLCMENPEVWHDSGLWQRIETLGLPGYLDRRADLMLQEKLMPPTHGLPR